MKQSSPAEKFDNLYRLQDTVLNSLSGQFGPFYITGGVALSRFYLNHRFTNDLDLLVSRLPCFKRKAAPVINLLKTQLQITDDCAVFYPRYLQLWSKGRDSLRVSLSNDIFEQVGCPIMAKRIPVDNMLNMLIRKLRTVIERDDPKDLFDILCISSAFSFNWGDVLNHAQKIVLMTQANLLMQFSLVASRFKKIWLQREPEDLFSLLGVPSPLEFRKVYLTAKVGRDGSISEPNTSNIESLPGELKHTANKIREVAELVGFVKEPDYHGIPSFFNLAFGGASIKIDLHKISVREENIIRFSKVPDELLRGMEWMHSPVSAEELEAKFERIRVDLMQEGENSLGKGKTPIEDARPGI